MHLHAFFERGIQARRIGILLDSRAHEPVRRSGVDPAAVPNDTTAISRSIAVPAAPGSVRERCFGGRAVRTRLPKRPKEKGNLTSNVERTAETLR